MNLTFDIEAGYAPYGHALHPQARMLCVAYKINAGPVRVCEDNIDEFRAAVAAADTLVAHNAKYDLHWLYRLGIPLEGKRVFDTMLAEWVLLGNNPRHEELNLEAAAKRRIGYKGKDPRVQLMLDADVAPEDIPRSWLINRCADDVETTWQLFLEQCSDWSYSDEAAYPLYLLHCDMAVLLTEIERNTLHVDKDKVERMQRETVERLAQLKQELLLLCGCEVNLRSIKETAPLVFDIWPIDANKEESRIKTLGFKEPCDRRGKPIRGAPTKSFPAGRPILDKSVIETLEDRATTKRQREWIRLRREIGTLESLQSKCLNYLCGVVLYKSGDFHADYRQGQTATHRLSAGGRAELFPGNKAPISMQAQNMPRSTKSLIHAPDGLLCFNADAMQLEFRTAADEAADVQAIADVADPTFDAHTRTLYMLEHEQFNEAEYLDLLKRRKTDKSVDEKRTEAKPFTFKPLFGGEYGTDEQMRYFRYFKERYPGIAAWQQRNIAAVAADKQFTTSTGLTFYFPDATYNHRGDMVDKRTGRRLAMQICNYPVQHKGAVIVYCSLLSLRELLMQAGIYNNGVWLCNTVHDSIMGYLQPEYAEVLRDCVLAAFGEHCHAMLRARFGIDYKPQLGVELEIGHYLGDGSRLKASQSKAFGGK